VDDAAAVSFMLDDNAGVAADFAYFAPPVDASFTGRGGVPPVLRFRWELVFRARLNHALIVLFTLVCMYSLAFFVVYLFVLVFYVYSCSRFCRSLCHRSVSSPQTSSCARG
jgi:hypothetical protein